MPITPEHIRATVGEYLAAHPAEKAALSGVLEGLDRGDDLTGRSTGPLHVTVGAVLVDDIGDVLFIRHNIFRKYLLPGGHLETEDESLMDAARRELGEETGIEAGVASLSSRPVHIDVHDIPANEAKGEPAHQHADVRYLFRTTGPVEVTLQEEEVSGWEWRSPDTLADATLRQRVLAATHASS
ncbi:NUDIX domain-containing protein [Streptomyces bauhiniae]|uniref:NUDIX domain-containing protein n=1 Tax=Streptomyces bauhiniae TaxID=2340725 RepID=A0A4Z1DEX8_9ACTN|nr:NUDIX domain-containing protein [Streptomyces bauhiniae]TGN81071.1 NUDIX domain-containing protein [Streptomyces bauhiniae]